MQTTVTTLRKNINLLMALKGIESESVLAKRAKVDQRTLNKLLSTLDLPNPTAKTIGQVASALEVQSWMLYVPDFPFASTVDKHDLRTISAEGYALIHAFENANPNTKVDILKHLGYLLSKYEKDSKSATRVEEATLNYIETT